jgi:hypothetical protein
MLGYTFKITTKDSHKFNLTNVYKPWLCPLMYSYFSSWAYNRDTLFEIQNSTIEISDKWRPSNHLKIPDVISVLFSDLPSYHTHSWKLHVQVLPVPWSEIICRNRQCILLESWMHRFYEGLSAYLNTLLLAKAQNI